MSTKVVFPAPDAPIIPIDSPFLMDKVMFLRIQLFSF